jgi:hypothetical protein
MKRKLASIALGILVAGSFTHSAEASSRQSIYIDLSMNNTFYEDVYTMNMKGVLEEEYIAAGLKINPSAIVTRGDAALMLYKLLGMETESTTGFPDVSPTSSYYDAVNTVASRGIVSGYKDGNFRPEVKLTRSQMSRIIAGAFEYTININATVPFTDVNERWAPYVDALYRNGVTAGVTKTSFAPDKQLTRGEMAAFMNRAYKKVPGSSYNDDEIKNTVNEVISKSRHVFSQGLAQYYPKQKASNISADMALLTMDPFLSDALADYETSCYGCDGPGLMYNYEFALPYKIFSKSNTLIKLEAIVPAGGYNYGHRATIELIRNGESWKIKSYVKRLLTDDPLNLTIEQSIEYLRYVISKSWNEEVVTIEHKGKEPRFGFDLFLVNGKDTYYFNVNTAELSPYSRS